MTSLSTRFAVPTPFIPSTSSRFRKTLTTLTCSLLVALGMFLGIQTASAQTETVLHSFAGSTSDGGIPYVGMIRDSSGNFYGTTWEGGPSNAGTIYEITSAGVESALYSFTGTSGSRPYSRLLMDSSGNLYGTTLGGGANSHGAIFELSPPVSPSTSWTETTLYSFTTASSGIYAPYNVSGLIMDSSGNLYGTASEGGPKLAGGVWEFAPSTSTFTTLYTFAYGSATDPHDGAAPDSGLIVDSSGNLYGTTSGGGNGYGTVYEISGGAESVLYTFGGTGDGKTPGGLAMDSSGNLYGMTYSGGAHPNNGTAYELSLSGGVWSESRLFSFGGYTGDGSAPASSLVFDSSGNLYGTTNGGGAHSHGTVVELTPTVSTFTETILYSFTDTAGDGSNPDPGDLIIDSSGNLYGTTSIGGSHNLGIAYKLVL